MIDGFSGRHSVSQWRDGGLFLGSDKRTPLDKVLVALFLMVATP